VTLLIILGSVTSSIRGALGVSGLGPPESERMAGILVSAVPDRFLVLGPGLIFALDAFPLLWAGAATSLAWTLLALRAGAPMGWLGVWLWSAWLALWLTYHGVLYQFLLWRRSFNVWGALYCASLALGWVAAWGLLRAGWAVSTAVALVALTTAGAAALAPVSLRRALRGVQECRRKDDIIAVCARFAAGMKQEDQAGRSRAG
jgi:hypothetical protein